MASRAVPIGTTAKVNPVAKRVGKLVPGKDKNALNALRTCEGVRVCAEPMGSADVLCRSTKVA